MAPSAGRSTSTTTTRRGDQLLEREAKSFLFRQQESSARRCATYRPTLQEFASTPFCDYVRETVLGVYEDSSDDDDDGDSKKRRIQQPFLSSPLSSSREVLYGTAPPSPSLKKRPTMLPTTATVTPSRSTTSSSSAAGCRILDLELISSSSQQEKRRQQHLTRSSSSKTPRMKRSRLRDGIAKITPPDGWWDYAGIAGDLTARGPKWQAGTPLGDYLIQNPIQQCVSGLGGAYEFTMLEKPSLTAAQFRDKADAFRKGQVGCAVDDDDLASKSDKKESIRLDELANKFWKRIGPTVEAAWYGADEEGSLFGDGKNGGEDATACGWNVAYLENCLQLLRAENEDDDDEADDEDDSGGGHFAIPGVTTPYLYFGMWGSVFAAHTEDMNLLSINYLHAGAPKYWYAIAPQDSQRFESLVASRFGSAATKCKEFMRHKRYLLSPKTIRKAGILYTTQIQRPGDIMITFPGSYHFGFNTGFNVAEATNFAIPEWVPIGISAKVCMCHPHSVRIDVKRFQRLLERYEEDMRDISKCGFPRMTYNAWATLEARRRRFRTHHHHHSDLGAHYQDNDDDDDNQEPTMIEQDENPSKEMVVPVVRYISRRTSSSSTNCKKRSVKERVLTEEWRKAVRARPKNFEQNSRVLSLQPSESNGHQFGEKFFSGVVSEILEECARIHFTGMYKQEDAWVPLDSPKLFLDGGEADPPKEESSPEASPQRKEEPSETKRPRLVLDLTLG